MKKFHLIQTAAAVLALTATLAGCSQPTKPTDSAAGSTSGSQEEVRKIAVGIGSTFEPYAYIDDKNQPAGYDYAVLKAVDELLPQYEFTFESIELKTLLVSIDAGKIKIASQQFERNPDRESKYLFTNEGFANYNKRIVYAKDRTDIHTIDDLAGKKVAASQGSNTAAILEKYNQSHDKKIEIVYGGTATTTYDDLISGRIDAGVMTRKTFQRTNDSYGGGLAIEEGSLFSESEAYYILAKDESDLRDAIDGALKTLKEDGTLTSLSKEYTGSDYNSEF